MPRSYIPSNEYGTNWISDLRQTTKKIIQEGLLTGLGKWSNILRVIIWRIIICQWTNKTLTICKHFYHGHCYCYFDHLEFAPLFSLVWQPETLSRNESGRFGALKSDSTHQFFRNACTKSGSLRFSQFSGCWLILSVYIITSFDFPFVRLLGVRSFCYYPYLSWRQKLFDWNTAA
jgi:hypothetical protein